MVTSRCWARHVRCRLLYLLSLCCNPTQQLPIPTLTAPWDLPHPPTQTPTHPLQALYAAHNLEPPPPGVEVPYAERQVPLQYIRELRAVWEALSPQVGRVSPQAGWASPQVGWVSPEVVWDGAALFWVEGSCCAPCAAGLVGRGGVVHAGGSAAAGPAKAGTVCNALAK